MTATDTTRRYTLHLYMPDLGTFRQPGCASVADALRHVNDARAHDGLSALTLDTFRTLFLGGATGRADLVPEKLAFACVQSYQEMS
jgi:hypothetical protein